MLYRISVTLIISFLAISIHAQQSYYTVAFSAINSMLSENTPLDFRKAVFVTENAYYEGGLDERKYNENITLYTSICKGLIATGRIEYTEKDIDVASAQCAVYLFLTDSISLIMGNDTIISIPFTYNYDDFAGQKDWSNMFVSTMMETNKGYTIRITFCLSV